MTSEGDFWRRQRRLAQPAFHKQRIAAFAALMARHTSQMLDRWEATLATPTSSSTPSPPPVLDVHAEMMKLTFAIVGDALFSFDVLGEAEEVGKALTVALEVTNDRFQSLLVAPAALPTRNTSGMSDTTRRRFLATAGTATGMIALAGCGRRPAALEDPRADPAGRGRPAGQDAAKASAPDVTPVEDLMREHGVLRRVLLVYEESVRRIEAGAQPSAEPLARGATIIRRFIEDYHEKLEEEQLFPRFEKSGLHVDLVGVLRAQHAAGRPLTAKIQTLAEPARLRQTGAQKEIVAAVRSFIRMYRPHAAREDTVLFPALHGIASTQEYDALGETFEDRERALFGSDGFASVVGEVEGIEQALGIGDLAQLTPRG